MDPFHCSTYDIDLQHTIFMWFVLKVFHISLACCRAYFALDVLNVISELLGYSKDETIQTLGCQSLTRFIFCQVNHTILNGQDTSALFAYVAFA